MIKKQELTDQRSCMSRARDDEMVFVLLGRDVAASAAIRAWIQARIRLGKNLPGDAQIVEAEQCAAYIQRSHDAEFRKRIAPNRESLPIPCTECGTSPTVLHFDLAALHYCEVHSELLDREMLATPEHRGGKDGSGLA